VPGSRAGHLDGSVPGHQDVFMRTTLTLDPDVATMLAEETHRLRRPYKQVVNDAIRRGLSPGRSGERQAMYRVVPHRAALLPGLDRAALNKYADETEDAAVVDKARRVRTASKARKSGR
jgi:hypothetical protein